MSSRIMKNCMLLAIRFRYWLPVNSSTIYGCRRPLISGIVHISLPVLFVVLQQLHFHFNAWGVSTAYFKSVFYRRSNFVMSWQPIKLQKWTPIKFFMFVSLPRSSRTMKNCMFLASDFDIGFCKFVDYLQMSAPTDFGNLGRAHITSRTLCSPPVTPLSSP
jgi:hypothetical protein